MKFSAASGKVRISGRVLREKKAVYFGYSASFAEFTFTGTYAKAEIDNKTYVPGDSSFDTFVAVFIDGDAQPYARFPLEEGLREYVLYHSEEKKKTTVRLMKMSEAAFGSYGIISLETDDPRGAMPSRELPHRIEFIGDSITCGYGNEGVFNQDTFCTGQENPTKAYAVLTAQQLQAEFQLISWSGIGLISDYVDPDVNEPREEILMPELYSFIDKRTSEAWDFTRWKYNGAYDPDLVIINIGTNDASYTREIEARDRKFGETYYRFLKEVRTANPRAEILCILGLMDKRLCGQTESTVRKFMQEQHDQHVSYYELELQREEDGKGTDEHPSQITHEKLAAELSELIKSRNYLEN
ncbi:MAG: GDSL-type esterase/lipase family protein [Butyrivibrio sp.]|jgi:lysophospholipase L1-like esterase|nr:GDSL-type esterase/lipase family protein [Butyrivibrio sp.]